MYVGQPVHFWYRGRCNAALIVDFWEDQTIAHLSVFEKGGVTQHGRVERGPFGKDVTWHTLTECKDIDPTEVGGPEVGQEGRDAEPGEGSGQRGDGGALAHRAPVDLGRGRGVRTADPG